MALKLDHVNLVVRNMSLMADFYGRLGLHLGTQSPEWSGHHQTAGDDADVHLDSEWFTHVWNQGWTGGSGVLLCFSVGARDEVDRIYAEALAMGSSGQQPPYDAFWGARFAVVTDPEGNAVGLMSDVEPSMRSAPPDAPPTNG